MDLPVMPPVSPMLARAVPEIPPGRFYEPKFDGFRSIVFRDGDEVEIGSRNERPMTRYFPDVVAAVLDSLPPRCVVDGEIVVASEDRRSLDFWALQQRLHPAASRVRLLAERTPAAFVAFDLLALDDADCMPWPFHERRAALAGALAAATPPVHLAPITPDEDVARRWFEQFEGAGLDGVIAKQADDAYQPGKRVMAKIKHVRTADCVLAEHPWGGLVEAASTHRGGSRWNPDKDLSFVPLRPERVLEVRYDHMEGARFRHPPQFVRWRPDRDPRSCGFAQLEQPVRFDLADVLKPD
jgi:ATP-dependent DNA ligase